MGWCGVSGVDGEAATCDMRLQQQLSTSPFGGSSWRQLCGGLKGCKLFEANNVLVLALFQLQSVCYIHINGFSRYICPLRGLWLLLRCRADCVFCVGNLGPPPRLPPVLKLPGVQTARGAPVRHLLWG